MHKIYLLIGDKFTYTPIFKLVIDDLMNVLDVCNQTIELISIEY